jgi:F-type H+-transporting ATPase subunit epsilon
MLHLQGASQYERIEDVASFVGEDESGSFGILPGHGRFMTSLVFGLARYRCGDSWQYLALPGALLYFVGNEMFVSTRRFLRDENYQRISQALLEQLVTEEEELRQMKESLHRLEQEMQKLLWKGERDTEPLV